MVIIYSLCIILILFILAKITTQEKKRRWKPSGAAHSTSSVITVSVTKRKGEEIEIDEQEDVPDTHAADFKEELSDTKDRMEELDYEEPMQSSIAEVAEEVKVRNKFYLMIFLPISMRLFFIN